MFVLMWEKRNADDFLRRNAWYNSTPVDVALAHSMLPRCCGMQASPSRMQQSVGNSRSSAPYISSDTQRRRTPSYTWVLRCSAWSIHSSCLACGARLSQRVHFLHLGRSPLPFEEEAGSGGTPGRSSLHRRWIVTAVQPSWWVLLPIWNFRCVPNT